MLRRLDSLIESATVPAKRAEFIALKCCYLARIGATAQAGEYIEALRAQCASGQYSRAAIMVIVSEGVLKYFKGDAEASYDRLQRAKSLSIALSDRAVAALSLSWLASLEFSKGDYLAMQSSIGLAIAAVLESRGSIDDSRMRLFLVLADCNHYCGRYVRAREWYSCVRRLASKWGDEATISASIYNRAAYGLARRRIKSALALPESSDDEFVALEIDSAHNFHRAAGHASLEHYLVAMRAREMLESGNYTSAKERFEKLLSEGVTSTYYQEVALLTAELALCDARLGCVELARKHFEHIRGLPVAGLNPDDKLVIFAALIEVAEILRLTEHIENLKASLEAATAEYQNEVRKLNGVIDSLESDSRLAELIELTADNLWS